MPARCAPISQPDEVWKSGEAGIETEAEAESEAKAEEDVVEEGEVDLDLEAESRRRSGKRPRGGRLPGPGQSMMMASLSDITGVRVVDNGSKRSDSVTCQGR